MLPETVDVGRLSMMGKRRQKGTRIFALLCDAQEDLGRTDRSPQLLPKSGATLGLDHDLSDL